MPKNPFTADLELYGPQAPARQQPTLRQARRYCRLLARRHYENFTVANRLMPGPLRQHFSNVYAYCRWADDLADETGDRPRSQALLGWWEAELRACYQGRTTHPVFVALARTIAEFDVPIEPLLNLLVAFRQDQTVSRYETSDELLQYCRYSANPVGRLVLHLGRCHTADRTRLSDSICTGLQLANFCQDVAGDWDRGRIYVPQSECGRFGYDEAAFAARRCDDAFRQLLAAEVARAEGCLRAGLPLVESVPPDLRLAVALFVRGGLAVLQAIRRNDFDVWTTRPQVTKITKLRILASCWWRLKRGTPIGDQP